MDENSKIDLNALDNFEQYLYDKLIEKYTDYSSNQMNDPMFQAEAVIDIRSLAELGRKQSDALMVIVNTPEIRRTCHSSRYGFRY